MDDYTRGAKNKKIIKYYDKVALSNQAPYWDIDCTSLSDFDKGVILSLIIKKIIFKPRQILEFIERVDNRQKAQGAILSHIFPTARTKVLKRYIGLYEETKSRRDFRYDVLMEYIGKNQKILDMGCGLSPYCERLAEDNKLLGVDISKEMIRLCNLKWDKGLFLNADARNLPFKSKAFDMTSCFGVLILYKDIFGYLKELIRVTKETIIFDVIDSNELPYVSPWHLSCLCKYYLGVYMEQYQHDVLEIKRFMEEYDFYLDKADTFVDGISDSTKVLAFRKK